MPTSLQITAANLDPALLDLPWEVALSEWPTETLAALPRGISRHVVRFIKLSGRVIAIKEIGERVAFHEYEHLRLLNRLQAPAATPLAVVSGRSTRSGEPLETALVTEHLQFSLPYRAVFSQHLQPDTAARLIDALAVLLVRLHLLGFYWGDVSLSNTLFRRDAGAFAAYLVDAETSEFHDTLTPGQRDYDLDLAHTNIIGELMDLQAGGMLDEEEDPIAVGNRIVAQYTALWQELTASESFDTGERWRVAARINRLNQLGYDVGELSITTDAATTTVHIQPKVVDAGHHRRRLLRLTGLDAQENQARRMLNDLDSYRAMDERQDEEEEFVAHDWVTTVFEPTVRAVPRTLRGKLEPAEVFHEVLEHRWFRSEDEGRDVPMDEAVSSYVDDVLRHRPDERSVLPPSVGDSDELPTIEG